MNCAVRSALSFDTVASSFLRGRVFLFSDFLLRLPFPERDEGEIGCTTFSPAILLRGGRSRSSIIQRLISEMNSRRANKRSRGCLHPSPPRVRLATASVGVFLMLRWSLPEKVASSGREAFFIFCPGRPTVAETTWSRRCK